MIEKALIAFLAILVGLLSALIIIRWRRTRGSILLNEEAINELVMAIVSNIRAGKIQDIAGRVSSILSRFLECDKIIFLRYHKTYLELNYNFGIEQLRQEEFRIRLTAELQVRLKSFHRISSINELESLLSSDYLGRLKQLGLSYFFPVYLRENFYGLYFIQTRLLPENPTLQFLATALAFNLSAAYHIGIQEQQLKKYEDRVKNLMASLAKNTQPAKPASVNELRKYLRIKNSKHLIPELVNLLRRDCDFSRMAFCVQADSANEAVISVNWNLNEDMEQIFRENYNLMADKIRPDEIVDLKEPLPSDPSLMGQLKKLKDSDFRYLTTIPWIENKKAVLAWSGDKLTGDIVTQLEKFQLTALPLVENVNRYEKVEKLSYTDGLTGIHNFRYFQKRIGEEFMRAKRYERSLAFLIFDIDDLKMVNDRYGHLAGDSLLKSFGRILSESVRSNDVISRYGGDEFCLIMPETDRERTQLFMDRIREKIALSYAYEEDTQGKKYSVSIGGAVYPIDAEAIDELINAADMALLRAKAEGRNRSKLYLPEYNEHFGKG